MRPISFIKYFSKRYPLTRDTLLIALSFTVLAIGTFFLVQWQQRERYVKIQGGGSSFADGVYQSWTENYTTLHSGETTITYIGSDSINGLRGLEEEILEYAGVDFYISNSVEFSLPTLAGAVAVIYNSRLPAALALKREALVGIWNGSINYWNDAIIQDGNLPPLPHNKIHPAHRTGPSGTTFIFTQALSNFSSEWQNKYGFNQTINWPTKLNQSIIDNEEMLYYVRYTDYSIGYVVFDSDNEGLKYVNIAAIINELGEVTFPSLNSINAVVSSSFLQQENSWKETASVVNFNCSGCYPIVGFTYITFLRQYFEEACLSELPRLADFVEWTYTNNDALQQASKHSLAALNPRHLNLVIKDLGAIKCRGTPLDKLSKSFPWPWVAVAIEGGVFLFIYFIRILYHFKAKWNQRKDNSEMLPLLANNHPFNVIQQELERAKIGADEVILKKQIGRGSFAEVYEGEWRGTKVAVKKVLFAEDSPHILEQFLSEVTLMSTLRHPKIVQFLGATIQAPYFYMVIELCTKGNLSNLLMNKTVHLSFKQKLSFAMDTAQGMNYLHSLKPPIVHRDLKTQNLMVSSNLVVKVADFGLSRYIDTHRTMTYCGTAHICAPEVISQQRYSEKADVYSFGMCLWEIFTRRQVYEGVGHFTVVEKVVVSDMRPPVDDISPEPLVQLMTSCWSKNPEERPSFAAILPKLHQLGKTDMFGITESRVEEEDPEYEDSIGSGSEEEQN